MGQSCPTTLWLVRLPAIPLLTLYVVRINFRTFKAIKNEAFGLAGAYAPPALKGVDNPTFAHRLRLPLRGPTGGQTGLPTPRAPPKF
jgi:hypothetical protein